jgi:carboxymethylenebutenolidase
VGIQKGKVTHEHIYRDLGSLLAQVGLLDPAKLPLAGAEQARNLLDPKLPSNELIHRAERTKA